MFYFSCNFNIFYYSGGYLGKLFSKSFGVNIFIIGVLVLGSMEFIFIFIFYTIGFNLLLFITSIISFKLLVFSLVKFFYNIVY